MRARVFWTAAMLAALAMAGCLGGTPTDTDTSANGQGLEGEEVAKARGPVRIVEPSAAEDRRFGEDRPLNRGDLPSLLPVDELTGYNITRDYLLSMVPHPEFTLYEIDLTVENRVLFGVVISDTGEIHADRPTIYFVCSQHGNEPSGHEACLILIEYFIHGVDQLAQDIRQRLNIVMIPLANPDGLDGGRRVNHENFDINRDHMNLVTLEGRAIHTFFNIYRPEVTLDLHEFGGAGSQHPFYPTVPISTYDYFQVAAPQTFYNHDEPMLAASYELEALIIQTMWDHYGIGSSSHYKSTNFVASIARNHYGMHNSISLLFETGGGRDTINIDLRTHLQIIASFVVIEWTLEDPAAVMALKREADARASMPQPGIQGWLVPNQTDVPKLEHFLGMHAVKYTFLEQEARHMVNHYADAAGAPPQERVFPVGTLVVNRWQPDGRIAHEIFEAQHDDFYRHGPRDWGLDVWRILST